MKRHTTFTALAIALSLVLSSAAHAHDRDPRGDNQRGHAYSQNKSHHGSHGKSSHGKHWQAGQKVPDRYRGQHYVVRNWKLHKLHPPPRGYQWVNVNHDSLLVSVVTGVVLQAILNG